MSYVTGGLLGGSGAYIHGRDFWTGNGHLMRIYTAPVADPTKAAELNPIELKEAVVKAEGSVGGGNIVQFGKTENQIYHVFRHTDELGSDRSLVESAVRNHFETVSSQVIVGKPFNQIIEIGGQKIQYTAFKLSDGTFNIGRIHGVK